MKILLDGYFDHNLGDDLMLTLARGGLIGHEVFTDKSRKADVYLKVTGSGFLIHNNLGIAYRLRDMRREKKYAPMRAAVSCNISPFINRAAEKVIISQLKSYSLITVRDTFSYNYIKKNIPEIKCEKYPDIVFSLPDSMIPSVPCGNLLGIAVHNSMDFEKVAGVADGYIKETGCGVLLLCFDTGEENDKAAAERIKSSSGHSEKIKIIPYESIPDMLLTMKSCKVILCARLHSIILAARMGIPFVPMAYSKKTINALGEIGYDAEIYKSDSFDVQAVQNKLLNPIPYELNKNVITEAKKHIISFRKLIEEQG